MTVARILVLTVASASALHKRVCYCYCHSNRTKACEVWILSNSRKWNSKRTERLVNSALNESIIDRAFCMMSARRLTLPQSEDD